MMSTVRAIILSVILSVLMVFFITSCVPSSKDSSAASSEELARAYITARQAYNMEQVIPILADDVKITEAGDPMSVEDVISFLRYAKAVGLNWDLVSCEVTTGEDSDKVLCPVLAYNKVTQALSIDPVPMGEFNFVITDEKISVVDLKLDFSFWGPNVFGRTMGFLEENYPEDIPVMRPDGGVVGVSDEGLALWQKYSDEFAALLKSQ